MIYKFYLVKFLPNDQEKKGISLAPIRIISKGYMSPDYFEAGIFRWWIGAFISPFEVN
ncbi:hypothetical protein ACM55H_03040 [Flavobacterium sp. ZT3R17]|uniref:hypothetical protein n=1 Tax=Flavobacterium cryoconiti TaxID=3398736 RepID=UPI003A855F2E